MTPEEIAELWRLHVEKPSGATLEALVVLYDPLARYLAKRALAKAPAWQDKDDMLSFAHMGLLDAIAKFEPGRGLKFETYATRRIGGAIIDWQRRMDPLTRSERKGIKELDVAARFLENNSDTSATIPELATYLELPEAEIRRRLVAQRSLPISLNVAIDFNHNDDKTDVEDGLGLTAGDEAETNVRLHEARAHLASVIPRLGETERAFLLLYYCENRTLREVGVLTGEHEVLSGRLKVRVLKALHTG